jgi:hypothetical protein
MKTLMVVGLVNVGNIIIVKMEQINVAQKLNQ